MSVGGALITLGPAVVVVVETGAVRDWRHYAAARTTGRDEWVLESSTDPRVPGAPTHPASGLTRIGARDCPRTST